MNFRLIISLLFALPSILAFQVPLKDHSLNDYFAIELDDTISLELIKNNFPNWKFEHDARGIPNHYVFSKLKDSDIEVYQFHDEHELVNENEDNDSLKLQKRTFQEGLLNYGIKSIHLLPPKHLIKRAPIPEDGPIDSSMIPIYDAKRQFSINDPEFPTQWHLINPNSLGNDVNVTGVWARNITGKGVVTALVDDGLDYEHEDLKNNFNELGSWDFNSNRKLPKPTLSDDYHGTRCAGEIAAVKNDVCGIGVAYDSQVAGIRILSGQITVEDEAAALVYGLEHNDIYSCSWGPSDDGKAMQAPDLLVKKSLIRGVHEGRQGKGAIYVYASGNGGLHGDNCNYDGYTNSIYSITVGALDHLGLHPPYSEACSAVLVVTYSSGSREHIHSTDIHGGCTDTHGGTSAAAPLAAGIYSLVLSANPNLTWRDVQYLTIHTSVKVNEGDGHWQEGAISPYSHTYGYGKLDTYRIVELAETWENVNEQVNTTTGSISLNEEIADNYEYQLNVTSEFLQGFKNLEHIVFNFNMDASIRGKVAVDLVSPSNMVSNLGVPRKRDISNEGFQNWNFMTVAHWGDENFEGIWKIKVTNTDANNKVLFKDFKLNFFGQKRDEELTPIDGGNDENEDEDEIVEPSSTEETAPTQANDVVTESSSESEGPTNDSTEGSTDNSNDQEEGKYPHKSSHLTEYFAVLIIVGFSVLLYFYKLSATSRKRREQYEFDIIRNDSDTDSEFDFDLTNRLDNDETDATATLNESFGGTRRSQDTFDISDDEENHGDQGPNKNTN